MKQLFSKWCFMLSVIFFVCTAVKASDLKDYQLIRRAFLEILHIPPTPLELEWYLVYNENSYETAVEWIATQTKTKKYTVLTDKELINFLNSSFFKSKDFSDIDQNILKKIIKYQTGSIEDREDECDKKLIQISVAFGENNIDVFDYMSMCLIARATNVDEANSYLEIYKNYKDDESGYLAVLNEMKKKESFTKK